MRYSSLNRGFPAGNPLANVLVIVVGSLVIAASIVLGFFVFVILGSVLLVMAALFGLRLWWLRHRIEKSAASVSSVKRPGATGPQTIEGEYHVVLDERDRGPPGAA